MTLKLEGCEHQGLTPVLPVPLLTVPVAVLISLRPPRWCSQPVTTVREESAMSAAATLFTFIIVLAPLVVLSAVLA